MAWTLRYRGRDVSESEIAFLRRLIAEHPGDSRRVLSKRVCEAWGWVQPNGALRDMVCRGLMLHLHRAGLIELPPRRCRPPNNVVAHRRPAALEVDQTPLHAGLSAIRPLRFQQVRRSDQERLFDALLQGHHYLGYTRPVGEHLKYLVWSADRALACLAWSSAPRHLGPRDRFIGWSPAARRRNIHLLAYNLRFLILPWVQVPHLASHILSRMERLLPREWQRVYGHPVCYLETFIDPARFRGTCYRAANWIALGPTTGRGKDAPTMKPTRPVKEVLGRPLTKRFRVLLSRIP
jgi:hypothetical protein